MFRLAIKSMLAKKRRMLAMALSVMLGVAFLAGTFVFTDTIQRTFDDLFEGIYDETDTVVRAAASVETETGLDARGRIPEAAVELIAAVDGVATAEGSVTAYAQVVGADGDAIGDPGQGAPTFGTNFETTRLNPWTLTEGSRAPGPGELLIDQGTAEKGDLAIGDMVSVITQTGVHQFPLVGTVRFGSIDSPGGASVSLFDLATAQEALLGTSDEIDAILVDAQPGISETEMTERIEAVLPEGFEALTGSELTAETQDVMREALGFITTFLLAFAAIGLVVACFTIYNTFQIIVTQRSKEMAMLRALGATRRQVLGSQLLEAFVLGVLASVLGLLAGLVIAGGLKALMSGFGIDIPAGDTVFATRTAVVALVVGSTVTVCSAVFPSIRASKVRPLAAIRSLDATPTLGTDRRRLVEGLLVLTVGIVAFVSGLTGTGLLWVGIGALMTFIAVSILSPLLARPFTRWFGAPIARLAGTTGLLARQNAARNPKRTARSGGALMIGVSLVTAIAIIAATAKDWSRDVFGSQIQGDYVVATASFGYGGLSPTVADRLNALPEVDAAAGVRIGWARDITGGEDVGYVAIDPAVAGRVFDLGMVQGTIEDLTDDGILVFEGEADSRGLAVGDQLEFGFLNGTTRVLTVQGIYGEDALAGPFVISHALHEASGADQFDFSVYVRLADGVSDAEAERALSPIADDYGNAELQSRDEYIDSQAAQIDQIVNLMYGLLALAILIALLSIANSISLSIFERTREIGLLRAVGMTRHQVGSVVRWEVVIISVLGTILGVVLGMSFGWAISVTLRNEGLGDFVLPITSILITAALAVAGSLLASLRPAWRAAHTDVLHAIASE
jgi:putative ABC transport system permease protein